MVGDTMQGNRNLRAFSILVPGTGTTVESLLVVSYQEAGGENSLRANACAARTRGCRSRQALDGGLGRRRGPGTTYGIGISNSVFNARTRPLGRYAHH